MILRSTAREWLRMILRRTTRGRFGSVRVTAGVSVNMVSHLYRELTTHSYVGDLRN